MLSEEAQKILSELKADQASENEDIRKLGWVIRIMEALRAPDGCPWDREQTHESLLKNLLEEAYEYVDAVKSGDDSAMQDELGDLFMQVVFHAQVAAERGAFNIGDVVEGLTDKLIRRHPHVFGDRVANNADEALESWTDMKKLENPDVWDPAQVPRSMPALLRARKVQQKTAKVGFEWKEVDGAFDKLEEEIAEMRAAVKEGKIEHIEEEIGDVIFGVVNVARYLKVCPEVALTETTDKFIRRFSYVIDSLRSRGLSPEKATLEEMDVFWDEAKRLEGG
jgi:tetrapyrrole methylase family protein/MazG family protein